LIGFSAISPQCRNARNALLLLAAAAPPFTDMRLFLSLQCADEAKTQQQNEERRIH